MEKTTEFITTSPKCCKKFMELKTMQRDIEGLRGRENWNSSYFAFQCKKCGKLKVISID